MTYSDISVLYPILGKHFLAGHTLLIFHIANWKKKTALTETDGFSQQTKPPFMVGIFHSYVSHNQMIPILADCDSQPVSPRAAGWCDIHAERWLRVWDAQWVKTTHTVVLYTYTHTHIYIYILYIKHLSKSNLIDYHIQSKLRWSS